MSEETGLNSSSSLVRVIYDDLASLSIPEDRARKRRNITLAETCVLSGPKEKSSRHSYCMLLLITDLISSLQQETFFQTLLLTSPFCHSLLRHEFLCAALQHCLDLLVGTSQQRHVFLVPIFAL